MAQVSGGPVIPATFDNSTKLLRVNGQNYVGIVTYGLGVIGLQNPRTAHSYIPEIEAWIGRERLKVEELAVKLGDFFKERWEAEGMPKPEEWINQPDMVFLLGGYDEGEPYGRVYEIAIPSRPIPKEYHASDFGPVWGGQEIDKRLRPRTNVDCSENSRSIARADVLALKGIIANPSEDSLSVLAASRLHQSFHVARAHNYGNAIFLRWLARRRR